jgi:tetratricopeptide (TPR) repeat protein
MSSYRLWLFRITAIFAIPTLLLIFLEIGLRIVGFGHPTRFTATCEVNGRIVSCENHTFSRLFFPPKLARPTIPFVLPLEKPAKTYRIFLLGGSAAQGDPDHTFGLARILKIMLQDRYPETNFEVINSAVTAINSHVVYQIAKDLVRHQPDFFILYLGNNEVVGPFGAGTVFAPLSPNLSLIRAGILLKSTRVGQALAKVLAIASNTEDMPEKWGGMEMFLQKQVRADEPGLETVYNHFQENLEDILQVARKAEIKTLVATVATNLKDTPPFASLHRRDISREDKNKWENLYRLGYEHESRIEYDQAIQYYLEAAAIDGGFADLQYRLAKCYWTLQDYDKARERYVRARDLDTLRFRVDTRVNNIIREVAKGKGVYFIDTVRIFEDQSPHKIMGEGLFYEHVHLNFRGNYILAASLFRQIASILSDTLGRADIEAPLLTADDCALRLAFTPYDRYRVATEVFNRLQKPPFTNQIYHEEQIEQAKHVLDELRIHSHPPSLVEAASRYRWAINRDDSDPWLHYNYAALLQESEAFNDASEELRLFLRYLPQYVPGYEKLVENLLREGKFEEAITYLERALQLTPHYTPAYYHMAFALAKQSKFDESIQKYRKVIELDPERTIDVYNQIGKIQVQQRKLEEAAETFKKAIAYNAASGFKKDVPDLHFNLGYVLKRLNKPYESNQELQQAITGYRQELSENPISSETHLVLGRALAEFGDYQQATQHFLRARDLDPTNLSKHINLIRFLEAQRRLDEAIEAAQKAIRLMLKESNKEAVTVLRKYVRALESRKLKHNSIQIQK